MAVELTAEYLREILDYDPETGAFTWKLRADATPQWNGKYAGKPAGSHDTSTGYHQLSINGIFRYAHRAAWLYTFGEWPAQQIDHINGVGSDNRISNLRLASHTENMRNTRKRADNTSGFKGVSHAKHAKRWRAKIQSHQKQRYLGCFDTPEEAHAAYCKAAAELYGEFANTGT